QVAKGRELRKICGRQRRVDLHRKAGLSRAFDRLEGAVERSGKSAKLIVSLARRSVQAERDTIDSGLAYRPEIELREPRRGRRTESDPHPALHTPAGQG